MIRVATLLLLASFLLGGCAVGKSEFGCNGYPDGVQCTSVREVYELTEYQDHIDGAAAPEAANIDEIAAKMAQNSQTSSISPAVEGVRGYEQGMPLPIRTPSSVMRIWVAPWVDKVGALHMPTILYTEVVERQWVIGEQAPVAAPQLHPLQVEPPRGGGAEQNPKNMKAQPQLNPFKPK